MTKTNKELGAERRGFGGGEVIDQKNVTRLTTSFLCYINFFITHGI